MTICADFIPIVSVASVAIQLSTQFFSHKKHQYCTGMNGLKGVPYGET